VIVASGDTIDAQDLPATIAAAGIAKPQP
jgi:hypothetical protein